MWVNIAELAKNSLGRLLLKVGHGPISFRHMGILPKSRLAQERFLRRIGPDTPFYQLFDLMPEVSFFVKDLDCRLICANRSFVERLGLRDELDIVGRDDFELFPMRLAESFRHDDLEVMTTGRPKLDILELFFNEQGIPDWFLTNKLPLHDRAGKVIGLMGIARRYAAQEHLMQAPSCVEKALAFIRENFRRRFAIKELADLVHLSPRQLHRKFIAAFGSSPQAFIMKVRVQAACETLQRADAQISAVAEDLGFCDQSAFTQLFQKHVGLTPLKYQQQFRLRAGAD